MSGLSFVKLIIISQDIFKNRIIHFVKIKCDKNAKEANNLRHENNLHPLEHED